MLRLLRAPQVELQLGSHALSVPPACIHACTGPTSARHVVIVVPRSHVNLFRSTAVQHPVVRQGNAAVLPVEKGRGVVRLLACMQHAHRGLTERAALPFATHTSLSARSSFRLWPVRMPSASISTGSMPSNASMSSNPSSSNASLQTEKTASQNIEERRDITHIHTHPQGTRRNHNTHRYCSSPCRARKPARLSSLPSDSATDWRWVPAELPRADP